MAKCEVISESFTFKPVTLQVTLESQDEVDALYHILTYTVVNKSYKDIRYRIASVILENLREYAE